MCHIQWISEKFDLRERQFYGRQFGYMMFGCVPEAVIQLSCSR